MSIKKSSIWATSPHTTRGQPTPLSANRKGDQIAYASNKSVFVRSIDNPEISKQYTSHTAQTTVARFAPSGFYIASGDVSGNVRVWDCVGEGATKGEYHIIAGRINDIAWDGDSQRIIAVGDGKERFGHCITADSGNSVGEISGHSAQINSVSIRQQRPYRAATGSDDTSVVFLHGAPFKYNTSLRETHNKFVYGTAFSPDGATLVSVGSDRRIWLYDGKTGEAQKQIGEGEHTGSIFGVSWSEDSKSFVTCSADQTVKTWDAEAGTITQTWRMGGDGISIPDQQVGVVWPHGRSDGLIISLDLDGNLNYLTKGSDKPVRVVRGHQRNITAAGVTSKPSDSSPNTIWTGSSEGRVCAWDVATGSASEIDGEAHSSYVSGFDCSSDSSRIYSVGWDDALRTIETGTKSFASSGTYKTEGQPRGVASHPSGAVLAATIAGLKIFGEGKSSESNVYSSTSCSAIAAAKDASKLVGVAGDDKTLQVYTFDDAKSSQKPFSLVADLSSHLNSAVSAIAFSPSSSPASTTPPPYLAVGTTSGSIIVFNTSDWSVTTTRWSAHSARVTALAWSSDSKFAVSGSLDTNVFVWSLANPGKRIKAGNAHKDGCNGVVWLESKDESAKVGSVGADAAVKVWEVDGLS